MGYKECGVMCASVGDSESASYEGVQSTVCVSWMCVVSVSYGVCLAQGKRVLPLVDAAETAGSTRWTQPTAAQRRPCSSAQARRQATGQNKTPTTPNSS